MTIYRNFDYYGCFLPMRIYKNDLLIGKLTITKNNFELNDIHKGDKLKCSFGRTQIETEYNEENSFIIEGKLFSKILFLICFISLAVLWLFKPANEVIETILELPFLMLLIYLVYYYVFNPKKYLYIKKY